jgi:hypothetical protein
VGRLPEKYRAPFVLCYLQGKANEEVARDLHCPQGTVLARLSRARERLRARLTRRGLTPAVASLAALFSRDAALTVVPAPLAEATRTAAVSDTTSAAAALAERVLPGLAASKLKLALGAALALAVLVGGAVLAANHVPSLSVEARPEKPSRPTPPEQPAKPREPEQARAAPASLSRSARGVERPGRRGSPRFPFEEVYPSWPRSPNSSTATWPASKRCARPWPA